MMLYTILPTASLDTLLPEPVKQFCGYDKDYTIREASFIVRKLKDGNWLVSCKLCNAKYIANKCVEEEMTPIEIEMAKQFYGEANIFEDISGLEFAENVE